jgi:hypothetical protein
MRFCHGLGGSHVLPGTNPCEWAAATAL